MKTKAFWALAAIGAMTLPGFQANAQETVVVEEETVALTEVPCKTHYYSNGGDNWFIQLGAGVTSPFVENKLPNGDQKHHLTAVYNVGFGKWFSPYIGWRLSFLGGSLHWDNQQFNHAKWVNANLDFMWDMFNSFGGVNSKRVFSIVPFIGLGGAYTWDYSDGASTVLRDNGKVKRNSWSLPLSAGIQLRFRLCKYVDFFAEGRAQFAGDNFNNEVVGAPIDMNLSVIGGFSFNIGGADFKSYNPCDYVSYIANLNNQVNDLRGALATTSAALAAAEAQLPCPEIQVQEKNTVVEAAPMMATVRFNINSARIRNEEMVNVYNVAEWMKANPEQNVVICGYADKDTGTSSYNMALSKRRAEAVRDALVNKYGINPDRLTIDAEGSNVQPYKENNWNRIVIFNNNVQ
ncbi:MAG: OmpA family protein [Muribaculaceae bacterium]|nr:OmpA family protein [Muribaculaceae bacterium]MCI9053744.1 OmpA family protein [Muribaculaceae bacterium]